MRYAYKNDEIRKKYIQIQESQAEILSRAPGARRTQIQETILNCRRRGPGRNTDDKPSSASKAAGSAGSRSEAAPFDCSLAESVSWFVPEAAPGTSHGYPGNGGDCDGLGGTAGRCGTWRPGWKEALGARGWPGRNVDDEASSRGARSTAASDAPPFHCSRAGLVSPFVRDPKVIWCQV